MQKQALLSSPEAPLSHSHHPLIWHLLLYQMEGHIQETDESISTKPSLAQLPQSALLCVEMFQAPFKGDPSSPRALPVGNQPQEGTAETKTPLASLATGRLLVSSFSRVS